jgi:hypothetical protein
MVGDDVAGNSEQPEQILRRWRDVVYTAPRHQVDLGDKVVGVNQVRSQRPTDIAVYPKDALVVEDSKPRMSKVRSRSVFLSLLPIQWAHVSLFPHNRSVFQILAREEVVMDLPRIHDVDEAEVHSALLPRTEHRGFRVPVSFVPLGRHGVDG